MDGMGETPVERDLASIFTTAISIPAPMGRDIAKYTGAQVYSEENDIVLADSCVAALHSMRSREKRTILHARFEVHDIASDQFFECNT